MPVTVRSLGVVGAEWLRMTFTGAVGLLWLPCESTAVTVKAYCLAPGRFTRADSLWTWPTVLPSR